MDFSKIVEKYNKKLNNYKKSYPSDFDDILTFKTLESEIIRCKDYCKDEKEKLQKINQLKKRIILLASKYNSNIKLYSKAKVLMLKKSAYVYKLQNSLITEIKKQAKENKCQIYHISKVSPNDLVNNKLIPNLAANMFHTQYKKYIFGTIEEKNYLFYSLSGGGNQGYIDINAIRNTVFLPENIFDTNTKNKLFTTKNVYKYEMNIDLFEPQVDFRLLDNNKTIAIFVYFGEWTSSKSIDSKHFNCEKIYDISKVLSYYKIYIHNESFALNQILEEAHRRDFEKVDQIIKESLKNGSMYCLNSKIEL